MAETARLAHLKHVVQAQLLQRSRRSSDKLHVQPEVSNRRQQPRALGLHTSSKVTAGLCTTHCTKMLGAAGCGLPYSVLYQVVQFGRLSNCASKRCMLQLTEQQHCARVCTIVLKQPDTALASSMCICMLDCIDRAAAQTHPMANLGGAIMAGQEQRQPAAQAVCMSAPGLPLH